MQKRVGPPSPSPPQKPLSSPRLSFTLNFSFTYSFLLEIIIKSNHLKRKKRGKDILKYNNSKQQKKGKKRIAYRFNKKPQKIFEIHKRVLNEQLINTYRKEAKFFVSLLFQFFKQKIYLFTYLFVFLLFVF